MSMMPSSTMQSGAWDYKDTLVEALEIILEGTRLSMKGLFRESRHGFIGRMCNFTGRYSFTESYEGFDSGFLLGRLWLLYLHSGDEAFKEWALRIITPCIQLLTEQPIRCIWSGMDIYTGMCWTTTILQSEMWNALAVKATRNLIRSRWSEKAQLIMYAEGRAYADIDTPLRLLHIPWSARQEPDLMRFWIAHFDSLLRHGFIRADGSTLQAAHFDPDTHEFKYFDTTQGWNKDSTWSRGQAWAMHNFTSAYESTQLDRFREAAIKVSDWWVDHVPDNGIPYYDFNDPEREKLPLDTCAACIAANALIRLSALEPALYSRYRPLIETTMAEIACRHLSEGGLILHGTWGNARGKWSRPVRWPQEDIMPYGNYYYVEALFRELKEDWSLLNLRK